MGIFENSLSMLIPALFVGLFFGASSLFGGDPGFKNITPKEAAEMLKNDKSALLLDVRTEMEYSEAKVKNSKLIPVQVIESKYKEIESYKDKPVLVLCRSGNRSSTASKILKEKGFTKVFNIQGGITRWADEVGGITK